jgi:hypothetical protein
LLGPQAKSSRPLTDLFLDVTGGLAFFSIVLIPLESEGRRSRPERRQRLRYQLPRSDVLARPDENCRSTKKVRSRSKLPAAMA